MNRLTRGMCSTLLMLSLTLVTASAARAGAPRTHDGYFFRFSIGGGTANESIEPGGGVPKFELSGTAIDLDLAIGGMVKENLALHATVFGWSVTDPKAEQSPFPSQTLSGTTILSAYGVGATYYLMPANVYFTGSVGMGKVKFDFPSLLVGDETDYGLALTAGLGKEWWLGESFGLGVSGHVTYNSAKDSTLPENWSGTAFGLRASLTYN